MSRTGNLMINVFFGVVGKVLGLFLTFVSRTVFIYCLGNVYLGVNGLYAEILSVLSVAELGFGSALIYALYSPVAREDREKILQLLAFYRKAYRMIAAVIVVLGLCILPFLQHIVKGVDSLSLFELRLYYLFFLMNTVSSYFVTYKYSYINALQKNYIGTNFDTLTNLLISLLQIIVMIVSKNYLGYLITHTTLLLLSKLVLCIYLNQRFPILKEKPVSSLPAESRREIVRDARRLAVGRLSTVAVYSTDNIIISTVTSLGVIGVGLVSNYTLLINHILGFVLILFQYTSASFGNIVATSSEEHYRRTFYELNFLNFWIYGFCSIAFYILVPPFIELWLGTSYLIDSSSFVLIIFNCYLQGQSTVYAYARAAKGDFGVDLAPSILQPIVNLVVSIIAASKLGLVGIYIGTVASRLVYVIGRPYLGFKHFFGVSSSAYFKRFAGYLGMVLAACLVTSVSTAFVLTEVTIFRFLMAVLLVVVVPNTVFLVFFGRSQEFYAVCQRMKSVMRSKRHE